MKTNTQSMQFPVEIKKIPGLILTISISARKEMLDALNAVGVGPQELPNMQKKLLEDARDILDGSLEGLIVSNLED
jgi:hypothetical protein